MSQFLKILSFNKISLYFLQDVPSLQSRRRHPLVESQRCEPSWGKWRLVSYHWSAQQNGQETTWRRVILKRDSGDFWGNFTTNSSKIKFNFSLYLLLIPSWFHWFFSIFCYFSKIIYFFSDFSLIFHWLYWLLLSPNLINSLVILKFFFWKKNFYSNFWSHWITKTGKFSPKEFS